MKLRNKKTGEIINAIFEPCEGNVKIVNKDDPTKYGEYASLVELNKEWKDVPEELKEYWYIDYEGGILLGETDNSSAEKMMMNIGNYFITLSEAEKAVEKLKAWKRLKDKGFRFIPEFHRIEEGNDERGNIMFIACTMNDDKDFIYGDNKDLKLLFGGEE